MQINNGVPSAHIFDYKEMGAIAKGGTVYKSGEQVVILPKGKPPDNWHKLQGQLPNGGGAPALKPMGKGEFMRSLIASGSQHAGKLGRDTESTRKSLLESWKAANEGKSSNPDQVVPRAVINAVKDLADMAHREDVKKSNPGGVLS